MDQFEAAKLKHAKNLERRLRAQAAEEIEKAEVVYIEHEAFQEKAPEERATDAVVEVKVSLPNGGFVFSLVKPSVLQNAVVSKLTKQNFVNGVMKGLEPLLGVVKEK